MDTMKTPGPDHPITLTAAPRRVRARFHDHVIADASDVIVLKEAGYHPVCYFRREDVAMEYMSRTDRDTYCPYKGHASYYSLMMDGHLAENEVWSYESPYPAVEAIAGRLAFFPNQVTVYEVHQAAAQPTVDQVVLHTDAGDGKSQDARWQANVSEPQV